MYLHLYMNVECIIINRIILLHSIFNILTINVNNCSKSNRPNSFFVKYSTNKASNLLYYRHTIKYIGIKIKIFNAFSNGNSYLV